MTPQRHDKLREENERLRSAILDLRCGTTITKETADKYTDMHEALIDKDDWATLKEALNGK